MIVAERPLVDLCGLKDESVIGLLHQRRKDGDEGGDIPYHCILEPDEVCGQKEREVGTVGQTLSSFYWDAGAARYVPSANKSSLVNAESSNKTQLPSSSAVHFERQPRLSLIKSSGR